jgi:hypothetical protein
MARPYKQLILVVSAAVFVVVLMLGVGFFYVRTGSIPFKFVIGLSTACAAFVALRSYFVLKAEDIRREEDLERQRIEDEQERQRDALFEEGCGEAAEVMSHLSAADFSVFLTCEQMLARGEGDYTFVTSKGSPMHHVLVALTDVRCARPKDMKRLDPATEFVLVEYRLTKLGQTLLPTFLNDAARRRVRRDRANAR